MSDGTVATLALYCTRCGNIHTHQFYRFQLKPKSTHELFCECGQIQAVIIVTNDGLLRLKTPCMACDATHFIAIDKHSFWYSDMYKIYCQRVNFELGLVGKDDLIQSTIYQYRLDMASLNKEVFELVQHRKMQELL